MFQSGPGSLLHLNLNLNLSGNIPQIYPKYIPERWEAKLDGIDYKREARTKKALEQLLLKEHHWSILTYEQYEEAKKSIRKVEPETDKPSALVTSSFHF